MINLYPYQEKAITRLRELIKKGLTKLIICAPTGSGKTVMFSFMVSRAVSNKKRCLIITDRTELLTQAGGTLSKMGLQTIHINPKRKLTSLKGVLYVGMAQTLVRRVSQEMYQEFMQSLDLIIIDEAHKQAFNSLLPYIGDKCIVIGATATPHREGNQACMSDFYQDIVEVVKIPELIAGGYLSRAISYGVTVDLNGIKTKNGDYDTSQMGDKFNEIQLYHGVYENYTRLTPNRKALIFSPNVESSKVLVEDFQSNGLPIEHIDANTPDAERKRILKWFASTDGAMLSNVGILTAGYDEPSIEVVILYRATKSLPLFLQMCGRGSRVTPSKNEFTIMDFGNNIQRHGFWEAEREWSLKKKKKKEGVAPVKECPSCGALLPTSTKECEYCHHHFEPTEKEVKEQVIAELKLLTYSDIKKKLLTADFQDLHNIAEAKGYSKGWIYHQLTTIEQLTQYAKWMGYHEKWIEHQLTLKEEKIKN